MFLITPAFAQTATDAAATAGDAGTASAAPGFLTMIAPFVLVLFVFYVLIIRPQNKRMIEHRTAVNNLQKGDKVVTGGGLLATVKKLSGEDEIVLEIAEGVEVKALRSTIMSIRK